MMFVHFLKCCEDQFSHKILDVLFSEKLFVTINFVLFSVSYETTHLTDAYAHLNTLPLHQQDFSQKSH